MENDPDKTTVVPENSILIEIRKLIGLGFSAMFVMLLSLLRTFRVYFQSRADLQTEILALRHQIVVLQRQTPKPKLKPADRRFWVGLSRFWSRWRSGAMDRETRYCDRLAPSGFSLVLDLEGSTWTAGPTMCSEANT